VVVAVEGSSPSHDVDVRLCTSRLDTKRCGFRRARRTSSPGPPVRMHVPPRVRRRRSSLSPRRLRRCAKARRAPQAHAVLSFLLGLAPGVATVVVVGCCRWWCCVSLCGCCCCGCVRTRGESLLDAGRQAGAAAAVLLSHLGGGCVVVVRLKCCCALVVRASRACCGRRHVRAFICTEAVQRVQGSTSLCIAPDLRPRPRLLPRLRRGGARASQ
jgi:hypothetical protein